MKSNRELRDELSRSHPDIDNYVAGIVDKWPPMSNEQIALWREARNHWLNKLSNPQTESIAQSK